MSDYNWPAWVRSWPCIDKNCDGKGTVLHGVYDHGEFGLEHDISQCQFCDEREKLAQYAEGLRGKERETFMAGHEAGDLDIDAEQAWQQYRCQDDSDFRAVPTKDTKS